MWKLVIVLGVSTVACGQTGLGGGADLAPAARVDFAPAYHGSCIDLSGPTSADAGVAAYDGASLVMPPMLVTATPTSFCVHLDYCPSHSVDCVVGPPYFSVSTQLEQSPAPSFDLAILSTDGSLLDAGSPIPEGAQGMQSFAEAVWRPADDQSDVVVRIASTNGPRSATISMQLHAPPLD